MNSIKKIALLLATFFPSSLRIALWRLLGMQVGRGARVSPLSIILADKIELGPGAVIEPFCFIYCPKLFKLDERARIAAFNRIVGYGTFHMHAQSFIALANLIDCTSDFELGARSQLGPRGVYYSHGSTGLIYNVRFPHRFAKISIGADVWVGMACIVFPGTTIGDRSLVFGGLTVQQNIPADKAVLGALNPLRLVPVEAITVRVKEDTLIKTMEGSLSKYATQTRGASLDRSQPTHWVLHLGHKKSVWLIRDVNFQPPENLDPKHDVVWTLNGKSLSQTVSHFKFSELKVEGRWTEFADEVAKFLCEQTGAHFIFESSSGNPSAAS